MASTRPILIFLLSYSFYSAVFATWNLTANPDSVVPNVTTDVQLECSYEADGNYTDPNARLMLRIVITKERLAGAMKKFAEISFLKSEEVDLIGPDVIGIVARGDIEKHHTKWFLRLTWPIATQQTEGTYGCYVIFQDKENSIVNTMTEPVSITVVPETTTTTTNFPSTSSLSDNTGKPTTVKLPEISFTDLQKVLSELKEKIDQLKGNDADDVTSLMEELQKKVLAELNNMIGQLKGNDNDDVTSLTEELQQVLAELNNMISQLKGNDNDDHELYWPSGPYALLATKSGCPDMANSQFSKGFITYWTTPNPDTASHAVSTPNHFQGQLFGLSYSQQFLNFSFCNPEGQDDRVPQWPKGGYCVHAALTCPDGFTATDLRFTLDGGPIREMEVNSPFAAMPEYQTPRLRFCCRSDGDPKTYISLPKDKPFYLYRIGGKCQSVRHMKVTDEWFKVDTGPRNQDRYSPTGPRPDGEVNGNDVTLQLCYYYPFQPEAT